jgi:hypothetical protein
MSENLKKTYEQEGKLRFYFDQSVPQDLYRGQRASEVGSDSPIIFPHPGFSRKNGPNRPSDVKIEDRGGSKFVLGCRCVKGMYRGVSTFNGMNPVLKNFVWYKLPSGTEIPEALAITQDSNFANKINHFTIAPKDDMPLDLFLMYLGLLERSLVRI